MSFHTCSIDTHVNVVGELYCYNLVSKISNALKKTFHRHAFCNGSKIGEMAVKNGMFLACAAHGFEVSGLDSVARRRFSNSYMDCSS